MTLTDRDDSGQDILNDVITYAKAEVMEFDSEHAFVTSTTNT